MNIDLSGKNALVGGSSRGIGKASAIALAELGASITLMARSQEGLERVMHQLSTAHNQKHTYLVVDYQEPLAMQSKINELVESKSIHLLVNNTGGPPGGPIVEARPEAFLDAYQKHLVCNHLLTQAVIPGMHAANYGRIINIISTSVKEPILGLGVSNTTRGAVASWAKTMSKELGPLGITVNNVLPGFTKTDRLDEIIELRAQKQGMQKAALVQQMEQSVPLRRFASPQEVGDVVAFLASPAAAYITGTSIRVDGGRTNSI